MRDEKKVLNLDELFGAQQPIAVTWAGVKHYLRRPDEMGPRDLVQYDRLNAALNEVGNLATATEQGGPEIASQKALAMTQQDGLTDEHRANAWDNAISEMIKLVGPSLLSVEPPMPFMAKMKVLEFYTSQITAGAPEAGEKKAPPPTGETSSPG